MIRTFAVRCGCPGESHLTLYFGNDPVALADRAYSIAGEGRPEVHAQLFLTLALHIMKSGHVAIGIDSRAMHVFIWPVTDLEWEVKFTLEQNAVEVFLQ